MKKNNIHTESNWYNDWRGWLFFLIINMSGNLFFVAFLPNKLLTISTFIIVTIACIIKKISLKDSIPFLACYGLILLLQVLYIDIYYSFSSNLNFYMKIIIGVLIFYLIKDRFIKYYTSIIRFFCIISLCCVAYNYFIGELPYIEETNSNIDDGYVFRATSVFYTQLLGNIEVGFLGIRNCGPFWEPGAFQGYINLALFLEIVSKTLNSRKFLLYTITIITTFSTGGYIVLFFNVLLLVVNSSKMPIILKVVIFIILISFSIYLYFELDFLGNKIRSDDARLGVSLLHLGDGPYFFWGYGLSLDSISRSAIVSVSSIYNLIRYVGVMGTFLYLGTIIYQGRTLYRYYYLVLICMILTNEPFISIGPFWWSIPFLVTLIDNKNVINRVKV